jgi:RNA polymerase sigma factor (sigma-70 family)
MRDDPQVIDLVTRANDGDQAAWNEIVERYAPLVWSICQKYRLTRPDIDDVGQSVWLLLVENLASLREPAALPGWLATTTHRECLRVVRIARRHDHAYLPPSGDLPADPAAATIEQEVLAAELDAAIRAAFAELPRGCRELLSMLTSDPPLAYREISAALGIAVGSIGPKRSRCLDDLRSSPRLAAMTESADHSSTHHSSTHHSNSQHRNSQDKNVEQAKDDRRG